MYETMPACTSLHVWPTKLSNRCVWGNVMSICEFSTRKKNFRHKLNFFWQKAKKSVQKTKQRQKIILQPGNIVVAHPAAKKNKAKMCLMNQEQNVWVVAKSQKKNDEKFTDQLASKVK